MNQLIHLLSSQNILGEGPLWDKRSGELYWVDISSNAIHKYDPIAGNHTIYPMQESVTSLAPRSKGGFIVTTWHSFAFWNPNVAATTLTNFSGSEMAESVRFNDASVDTQGRYWAGTYHMIADTTSDKEWLGGLYRCDPDGSIHKMDSGYGCTNGIGWSPDNHTMYVTDSLKYAIYAYDYAPEDGNIANRRPLIQVPREFGGPNLETLYITTARDGLSGETLAAQTQAGDLFCYSTNVTGHSVNLFQG
jgi:sugar lactone lactonase YvrE